MLNSFLYMYAISGELVFVGPEDCNCPEIESDIYAGKLGEINVNGRTIHAQAVCDASGVKYVICTDITEYVKQVERLTHTSMTDELTRIPTRRSIVSDIEKILVRVGEGSAAVGLIYIDLDNFKKYNDLHGHHFGDEILKVAAERFKSSIRPTDLVARMGGDEYVVVVNMAVSDSSRGVLELVVNRIFSMFEAPMEIDSIEANIFCSAGICIALPGDIVSCADLIKRADSAMLEAKGAGRSNYQFYTEKSNDSCELDFSEASSIILHTEGIFKSQQFNSYILRSVLSIRSDSTTQPLLDYKPGIEYLPLEVDALNLNEEDLNNVTANYLILSDAVQMELYEKLSGVLACEYGLAISAELLINNENKVMALLGYYAKTALYVCRGSAIGQVLSHLSLFEAVIVNYDDCKMYFGENFDEIIDTIVQIASGLNIPIVLDAPGVVSSDEPNRYQRIIYEKVTNANQSSSCAE